MSSNNSDIFSTELFQGTSALDDRSTSINHVVNDDTMHPGNFANDGHYLGLIGARTDFIDDGARAVKIFGIATVQFGAARIWRYDANIVAFADEVIRNVFLNSRVTRDRRVFISDIAEKSG